MKTIAVHSIHSGKWHIDGKVLAARGDAWELYDLRTDRAESHNLALDHPDKARGLATLWNDELVAMARLAAKTAQTPRKSSGR